MGFKERLQKVETEEEVYSQGVATKVKVSAWRDPKDGEIYFDSAGVAELDRLKEACGARQALEQIKASVE